MHFSLIGREAELSALAHDGERAARGDPRVVHVSGPAGIGKSTIISAFLESRPELSPVVVSGAEQESSVHLGVADRLSRALAERAGIPPEPVNSNPLACGDALVELLAGAQGERGTIALAIDDLDWVDPASVVAITFTLRRLRANRVLVILAGRTVLLPGSPLARIVDGHLGRSMPVPGLGTAAVREFASAMMPRQVSGAEARSLRAHTGGNPLYLRTLLAELPSPEQADLGRLAAPASFADSALIPLSRSPEPTRRLIAAAAVLGMESRLADAADMAGIDQPLEAAAATPASLVRLVSESVGWTLRFTHPLNHAAVYHDLAPQERARLHRLAAQSTGGRTALWHRVRAVVGHDRPLADDLVAASAREAAAGRFDSAASYLAAAAALHPDSGVRDRLLLDAADSRLWGNDPGGAVTLLAAVAETCGPRWDYVQGHLAMLAGQLPEGQAGLEAALRQLTMPNADLRGPASALLAEIAVLRSRGDDAVRWAGEALDALPGPHPLASFAQCTRAVGLWVTGRASEALASLAALPADPALARVDDAGPLAVRGMLRTWDGDLPGGFTDCRHAVRLGRANGVPVYVYLTAAEYRLGRWDDAVAHAEVAVTLVADTDQAYLAALAHGIAALVPTARGDWDTADAHVSAAMAAAEVPGNEFALVFAANAAAYLAFARHDREGMVAPGSLLQGAECTGPALEPGIFYWREIYQEGLVALGRLDEARRDTAQALELARARGRRAAIARLGRPRAALALADGDPGQACLILAEAIEMAGTACGPFDQALLNDAMGMLLRRRGDRRRAADHLRSALERYDQLGAAPFRDRCAAELAACGLRPAKRRDLATTPAQARLTAREQAVADLAVQGLTNRQIATNLVISVKTVEYHLGAIFNKFGISTRTQLATLMATAEKD